jgi:magnesium transporter
MDELLEDAYVENQQAIEMAQIYRDVIDGTRDLISSVMDLRLNDVMQRLTSITIIMTIPTIVSGFFGMNVDLDYMPWALTAPGFGIICVLTALVCVLLFYWFRRSRLL